MKKVYLLCAFVAAMLITGCATSFERVNQTMVRAPLPQPTSRPYPPVQDDSSMNTNVCNSLILTTTTNCTGNRREPFLFVFNSFASLCRNVAVGRDGFVNSKIQSI